MAKRTTPRYEPEPQPAEATNDDILTAIRRVEKTLVAMTKDIADLSEDVDAMHTAIPQTQKPPNDGPAPPEPVVEPPSPDAQSQAARNG
jgi:hypothetical protein